MQCSLTEWSFYLWYTWSTNIIPVRKGSCHLIPRPLHSATWFEKQDRSHHWCFQSHMYLRFLFYPRSNRINVSVLPLWCFMVTGVFLYTNLIISLVINGRWYTDTTVSSATRLYWLASTVYSGITWSTSITRGCWMSHTHNSTLNTA